MRYLAIIVIIIYSCFKSLGQAGKLVYLGDFSDDGLTDFPIQVEVYNDTVYALIHNKRIINGQSRSTTGLMMYDSELNLLEVQNYDWIKAPLIYTSMRIIEDQIVIAHGETTSDAKQHLTFIDKNNLDSLKHIEIHVQDSLVQVTNESFHKVNNQFVVNCRLRDIHENWYFKSFFIDDLTFQVDTILPRPPNKKYYDVSEVFVTEDMFIFDVSHEDSFSIQSQRKFILYDFDKNVIKEVNDSDDLESDGNSINNSIRLKNGLIVFTDNPHSVGSVRCLEFDQGEVWRMNFEHRPFWSLNTDRLIESTDGNVIVAGSYYQHFVNQNIFWENLNPIYSTFTTFETPYLIKLDSETGEVIWDYSYVDFDEYGYVPLRSFTDVCQLSDGTLVAVGIFRNHNDSQNHLDYDTDSFILTLDENGCYVDSEVCEFNQFLDENPISNVKEINGEPIVNIYPNPTSGEVTIELPEVMSGRLTVRDINGHIVINQDLEYTEEVQLDLSTYHLGMYVVDVLSKSGERWVERVVKTE